jgi:alpha-tubulin suppressor-like RCC1 family protein
VPSFATYASTQATAKVWNATTGGVPSNWEQPGFNDSGWSVSSAPTVTGGIFLPSGAEALAPWTVASSTTETMLYRTTFTVPAAPWEAYLLEQFTAAGGYQYQIYIDGTALSDLTRSNVASILPAPGATVTVASIGPVGPAPWLTVTGGGYEAWMGWRMTFYIPDAGGQPYSWGTVTPGDNDKGWMGVGDTATHLTPTPVDLLNMSAAVVKVVSNGKTTLFLTADGTLYACGDNSTGLLLTGTTDSLAHPTPVSLGRGNFGYADVSIGDDCAIAIQRSGESYVWGPNAHGSLGRGDTTPVYTRSLVPGSGALAGATRVLIGTDQDRYIAAGKNFAYILLNEAANFLQVAGDNTYGQLGLGTSGSDVTSWQLPGRFSASGPFIKCLAAGVDVALVAYNDGSIYGCGRNEFGAIDRVTFLPGSGTNRIVNTQTAVTGFSLSPTDGAQLVQADRLSFNKRALPFSTVRWYGDGEPYGGNAHGVVGSGTGTGLIIDIGGSGQFPAIRIAECSGGSQNPSGAVNDSHVTYGAIELTQETADLGSFDSGVMTFGAADTLTLLTITDIDPPPGVSSLASVSLDVTLTSTWTPGNPTRYNVPIDYYDADDNLLDTQTFFSGVPFTGGTQHHVFSASIGDAPPYTAKVVFTADTNGTGAGGPDTIRAQVNVASVSDPLNTGKLYTWGWGGAGQMGSGADATSNLVPIWQNGLTDVLAATVCAAGMFAIAAVATVVLRRRPFGWAAVIG